MLDFLTLKPTAFGLDISDLSLKIIKLGKRGKFLDLVSFGETRMKLGIIEKGEIKNEKALIENIKKATKAVQGEKLKTKYVIASLPEEEAFLQVIHLPMMKEEEVKKAVYFEAENYIPMPIEKVYLDSQIISRDPKTNRLNVLIAALPKTTIDQYIVSLKKAGLKPLALEIECLAIARALIKGGESAKPLFLIDLGENRTSFSIFLDNSLRFTASRQISSKKFTEAIAKDLNLNFKKADTMKLKYGIDDTQQGKKIAKALSPVLSDLITQTKKHLNYCERQYNQQIGRILLCGGGVNLRGFVDLFSKQLKVPVELGNPWINILPDQLKETEKLSHQESLRYTTALGLALRGVKP